MLQPGEEFPSEASVSSSSATAAKTPGSTLSSGLAGLGPPSIAGIVLGVLGMCCVILAIILTIYLRYRGRRRVKPAEAPTPSSLCQITTTTPNTVPEQGRGHVTYQVPDQTANQAPGQAAYMSPCSPGSVYGFSQSPSSPPGYHPVEIYSKEPRHELPVPDSGDPRTPR
jgi:hypothetical protein